MISFDFTDKTCVVTGAGSGIGRELTRLLLENGGNVVLMDCSSEGMAETVCGYPDERYMPVDVDLTDLTGLPRILDLVKDRFGAVDGLVHCAGISSRKPMPLLNRESFDRLMSINFFSFVELVRLATKRQYFADAGSVVVMSSISSIKGYKAKTEYCVSKAAVDSFVRCAALELANRKIRVNSIMPGEVLTPMALRARACNEAVGAPNFTSPLGSTEPYEVANTIAFLLSDATKTITGTSIVIDGGATI